MIKVTNLVYKSEIREILQALPINKYLIWQEEKESSQFIESCDVIIATVKQAKNIKQLLGKTQVALILYLESVETLATTYQLAQQLQAFAVILPKDLKNLDALIDQAYDAVFEKRKKQFGQGKTVGVLAIKGGVGKSFISYHLASKLSTFTKSDPLLIDAGIPFGSAHTFLNIQSKTSWQVLRPLLNTGKDLTPRRLNSQVLKTDYQFDILSAPENYMTPILSAEELSNLLTGMKQLYQITVVDMPVFPTTQLSAYAQLFDLLILIFTPDANSIIQTLETHKEIQRPENKSLSLLVCNRVEPTLDLSLIKSLEQKMSPNKIFVIDEDSEAIKLHQRKFELITNESLLLTKQLKELAESVFFKLTETIFPV
ncbi:MAG: hypothetical protein ABI425_03995 [Patescibacteria group bacterium]